MFRYYYLNEKTGLQTKTFSTLKDLITDAFKSNKNVHWKISINGSNVINKLYNTTNCVQIFGFIPGVGSVDEFILAEEIRNNLEKYDVFNKDLH